jgi:hypothetical protein
LASNTQKTLDLCERDVKSRSAKAFILLSDYDCHNVAGTPVTGRRKVDQQKGVYILVFKDRAGSSRFIEALRETNDWKGRIT